ncbi:hypothetical protein [Iodobacter fluviatilis]|uniref:Uncharacterized protein n=1 Tax=Iodobacter fluviatilis TaxID=537 RepID=A0A7G3G6X2_9NEIS|nr:hypothetical protein [Iodobacter fluviatilis]QBC42575.1 hypothetical protein C1H71_02730 [Iodobacter fluviatilis]
MPDVPRYFDDTIHPKNNKIQDVNLNVRQYQDNNNQDVNPLPPVHKGGVTEHFQDEVGSVNHTSMPEPEHVIAHQPSKPSIDIPEIP